MMIRSLRQLLKAYWKEHTKAQIKQKKSRLLIYDEHLKRFVSADELLIPNETCKVNKIGGPIAKRKSKDLLYDILLKTLVNTKLDIYSLGCMDDRPFCKINSQQQKYETISTSNKDFFWGKKYSGKKHRVPALPPVDRTPPLKEEETTNTGWAGQKTVDPETDPRPELRTSGDCPIGPSGKRPDKKKPHKKKNVGKRLIVCAKETHKIAEKELYTSITKVVQPKSKISDPSTTSKPKDQVQNSKASVVKNQECINKEDNVIKSRVHIGKHHNDLSEDLSIPCLRKTGGTKTSDPSSPSKPKDRAQNSKVTEAKNQDCINKEDNAIKSRVHIEKHDNNLSEGLTIPCLRKTGGTKTSDPSSPSKPKDRAQNSKVTEANIDDCINKEDNAIKSRVLISDKRHSDLSVAHTNPCLCKTGAIKISDPSNSKPKDQVQHSNFSEVKNQDCINKRVNVIKSTVLISEKHHSDFSVGQTNPCLSKTVEAVTASKLHYDDISTEKAIDHIKCNNSYKSTIVQTQNRSTKGKCINNSQETPNIGLNCEKFGKIKDQSGKTSDRVHSMPSNAQQETCKQETDLTCSYKDVVSENNNICENIKIEHQNSKINQPLLGQNLQKQTLSKDLPNKITKCDSNNNNKNLNKHIPICKNVSPEIGLNCTKIGQIKDQTGETNDRPKYETSNICGSSKKDSYSNASKCNNISRTIATEHQNIKINQPLSSQNVQKQILLKDLPKNSITKCQSSYKRNKDVTKNITFCKDIITGSELCNNIKINKPLSSPNANQHPLSKHIPNIVTTCGSNTKKNSKNNENKSICSSVESKCELTKKVNCSETNTCIGQTCASLAQGNKIDHSPLSYSMECQSNKAKTEALRQPDLSNNGTCSCKETETISKSASKKGLELGLKRPQEPITVCSVGNNNLDDTTKSTLIDSKYLDNKLSPKPCLSIENTKHCGIDSKVSEKLEAITQDKCLNEISHNNDLSKIKGECYMGFKIKKSLTELSDVNECNGLKSKPKELQSEKSKRSSSGGKIKKNKNNKSKGGKKLKKGCSKDVKAGIKEECLGKENTKEMLCKQEHNFCDTRIQNIKPNMCQKKHVVKRNKHKLQTINTLSSNMSSRHAKEILKKCKQVSNLKSNTKDKNNSSTILPNVETQGRKVLSENERLENKSEYKLKKQDQLLKTNRISSCKNKSDTKNIHDTVTEKQPSQTRLKQTRSTLTAKICSTRSPSSRIKKSEVLLKPVQKKVNNQNSRVMLKGLSNNTVSITKSSRKCNICSGKKISIQSSNPQNKQITQANVSDNCKATKTLTTNKLNSKATSLASQKLKKQEIRHFSALNLHNNEFKTLSPKAKPKTLSKFNTSKSEIGSYSNYTIKENKVLVNVLNQTSYSKGCKCSNEGKSQKTPFLASLAASKNGVIKSSCETIKIKEPNIVPIKAYTDGHDFPDNSCQNHLLNSSLNKLPFFTKRISGSPTQKREEAGSKSAIIVKPLLTNRIAKKNKSLTVLDSGNNVETTLERKKNVCNENPSLAKNGKVSPIKAETQTLRNSGRNNKGGIANNINSPISNEGNDMIRNMNKGVGIYNHNKQSKMMFLNGLKYTAEDQTSPEKVQIRPQEKHHTSVRDLVNIKNIETDRQLKNLTPLITNKTIKKDILPFVTKVHSDEIPQASIIPPKSNATKTTPKTSQKVKGLLKYNIPLKAANHPIHDQVKKEISKDSRNKKTSDPHCTKKRMTSTGVRNLLTGNKLSQSSVIKSNTFTVLSSIKQKNSNNVPKMKTFTVQASKIQKKNVPKTKTFTIMPSKSSKQDQQRLKCTVKKP